MIKKLKNREIISNAIRANSLMISKLFWDKNIKGSYILSKLFRKLMFPFSFEYPKGYSLSKGNEKDPSSLKERILLLRIKGDNRHNG